MDETKNTLKVQEKCWKPKLNCVEGGKGASCEDGGCYH